MEERKENGRCTTKVPIEYDVPETEKGTHSLPITPSASLVSPDLNQDLKMKH